MGISRDVIKLISAAVLLTLALRYAKGFATDTTAITTGIARVTTALDGYPYKG